MKILFTIALTIFLCSEVFGTAQSSDIIIYKGKEYSLYSNPMEIYFEKYPNKRPKPKIISSALWRGYVATFEIKDNQLFLKNIEIEKLFGGWKCVRKKVFPRKKSVKVDWLTGTLVIPYGEMVGYVHMGYASTYERYILLEIDKGDLKSEKQLEYEEYVEFREKQFQAFKKTEEYERIKAELKEENDEISDEEIDPFLRIYITDYMLNDNKSENECSENSWSIIPFICFSFVLFTILSVFITKKFMRKKTKIYNDKKQ